MDWMKGYWLRWFILVFLSASASAESNGNAGIIRLENPVLQVQIEQRGGQFVGVQLKENPLNPLSWAITPETMPKLADKRAVYKGHFLCMGRIGAPSAGEIEAGVPMRGEQTGRLWTICHAESARVDMACEAPSDGLKVRRTVDLHPSAPQFLVTETFENTRSLGRVHAILQHVTIGEPFLSANTRINSNAKQGFSHKFSLSDPQGHECFFPQVRLDDAGTKVADISMPSDSENFLALHIFDAGEEYGWVTAYDPGSGLVLGYIWKTADYPWINFWNQAKGGRPVAAGLEFGTAGIDAPYQILLENNVLFHGVRSWEYIDAGEAVEKSFIGFMVQLEKNAGNPALICNGDHFLLNGAIQIQNTLAAPEE